MITVLTLLFWNLASYIDFLECNKSFNDYPVEVQFISCLLFLFCLIVSIIADIRILNFLNK